MAIDRCAVRTRTGFRVAFGAALVAVTAAVVPAPAAVRTVPAAAAASSSSRKPDDAQSAECKGGAEACPEGFPVFADEVQARSSGHRDAGAAGRVEGTVTLGARLKAKKMRFALYPQDAQQALAEVRGGKPAPGERDDEFRNVVVYVESTAALEPAARAAAAAPLRGGALAIRQDGLSFVPHVLPVLRGSTVDFPNADPIFHNVFSLARAATFDLGRYPRGDARSVRFDTPGIVKVFCHIHSDMSAVVLVLDNPFFVTPDADGRFRLDGLPAGEYKVTAWHERAHPARRNVRIEPGRATMVTFDIPLSEDQTSD